MTEPTTSKARKRTRKPASSTGQSSGARAGNGSRTTSVNSKNQASKSILIIGRNGSGKTSFINTVGRSPGLETPKEAQPSTLKFYDTQVSVGSHQFRLIDSPGFDNVQLSDCEIFVRLVRHLASRAGKPQGLTGIIYIHSQGDNLGSAALLQNIKALKSLLGDKYPGKVTVVTLLMSPDMRRDLDAADCPGSPFHEIDRAVFRAFKLNSKEADNILLEYASHQGGLLGIQNTINQHRIKDQNMNAFVEQSLPTIGSLSSKAAESDWHSEHERLKDALGERTMEVDTLRDQLLKAQSEWNPEREKLQKALNEQTTEVENLRDQLQRTHVEYASLRSHFQIHENAERSEIAQSLVDINRQIDDFGRTISNYLTDTYSSPGDTSLDSDRPSGLKIMFHHTEGHASLVESSKGEGMSAPDFFDYAIRSILCQQLCQHIFKPFHPGEVDQKALSTTYQGIQRQESQSLAGMWRKNSFDSISNRIGISGATEATTQITEKLVSSGLSPLLEHFFGHSAGASLKQQHIKLLSELVLSAWRWNEFLKTSVVVLGDFQPTFYQCGESFDSVSMLEFEGTKGVDTPGRILSTIGLGMQRTYAIGEKKEPEVSVLCKALVVTERVFG